MWKGILLNFSTYCKTDIKQQIKSGFTLKWNLISMQLSENFSWKFLFLKIKMAAQGRKHML